MENLLFNKWLENAGAGAGAEPLLSIGVALSSWPEITLEVSEHFYVIFWFVTIFSVVILFNLVILSSGSVAYGVYLAFKQWKIRQNEPQKLLQDVELNINNSTAILK
jgi:hypothetical protein